MPRAGARQFEPYSERNVYGIHNIATSVPTNLRLTIDQLNVARETFESNEPRDLFYRAAAELVDLAIRDQSSLSVPEALAVLLQTWNKAYYRFKAFDQDHFGEIDTLISEHRELLATLRTRSIETYSDDDHAQCSSLFGVFENVLGPVGAAKALHLMAPQFFPLWDRKIAQAYGLSLKKVGHNSSQYCQLMTISKTQCIHIGGRTALGRNPLKAIDEYNYCRYTMGWI